ncbi:hypothetical protein NEIRO03_1011 [Nematocida sp. AWRm78]|nr:hypothetical protein NEIRO02_1103 [Nematocida sp. AWRm79]KAI5183415.1 hypothetical protein NEIRO03_1011 [Nematocida sp. AWRm78]
MQAFHAYTLYILLYSWFNSSETAVISGYGNSSWVYALEIFIVNKCGYILPYIVSYAHAREIQSIFYMGMEVGLYFVFTQIIGYIKEARIFLLSNKLPVNPSGHTFILLNGIHILLNINPSLLIVILMYEYNRILTHTIEYYHTFIDVFLGICIYYVYRYVINRIH